MGIKDLSSPPHTPSYRMWKTGMLSARQPHCPHFCNTRPFAFLAGAWGAPAQGPCKVLQARQELWLQVTPATTCGRFLEEHGERRRAALLGWGMQGGGWRGGRSPQWMQGLWLEPELPASGEPRGTKELWWVSDPGCRARLLQREGLLG